MESLLCVLPVLILLNAGECSQTNNIDFHCCTPKAWTSRMRITSASVTRVRGTDYQETWHTYHYDSENQREAWTDISQDGQKIYGKIIIDYKRHRWTILVDPDMCVVYKIQGNFQPHCTPGNFSMVLFALAPSLNPLSGVFANTVYYRGSDVTGHMTVTVGQCALLEEAIYRTNIPDVSSADSIKYFNQTLTVDPAVFEIPTHYKCPETPLDDATNSHIETISKLTSFRRSLHQK